MADLVVAKRYSYTLFVGVEELGLGAFVILPGPASTKSTVEGVGATYIAGEMGVLFVHARDQYGNQLTEGGHSFQVAVTPLGLETMALQVQDLANGVYQVSERADDSAGMTQPTTGSGLEYRGDVRWWRSSLSCSFFERWMSGGASRVVTPAGCQQGLSIWRARPRGVGLDPCMLTHVPARNGALRGSLLFPIVFPVCVLLRRRCTVCVQFRSIICVVELVCALRR